MRLLVAGQVVRQVAPGRSRCACSSAWPTPATLPWPKMPKQPAIEPVLDAVALGVLAGQEPHDRLGDGEPHGHALLSSVVGQRQARVDGLVGPGAADPGVRRVVADQPGPLGARAGHHVEVVEVVAGRGHRRAVPAVRDQHDVAGAHLGAARRSAGPGRCRRPAGSRARAPSAPPRPRSSRSPRARDSPVAVLVVLVRRVRRPVAARGEHLDGDQPVGLEGLGRAEVVDLPAGLPGAAQLDRHVLGRRRSGTAAAARPGRRAARTGRRSARATVTAASRGT